ncbi:MAG TPA: recombination mediator RecR [Pseudomonadota bacterium]|nr:recombination mediator RecR [Pseudomonadota bacterium]
MHSTDPITRLIRELARLPGIGQKTATRLAFHILRSPAPQARELAQALIEVKEKIRLCSQCMNLTEQDPCALCADPSRDGRVVCVVAHPPDLLAIERTSTFRGRYHVLHGVLSPLDGVGPDDLKLRELLLRVQGITPGAAAHPADDEDSPARPENPSRSPPIVEVIVATSPNVEGEATAMYIARMLKPLGLRVSRIASGLPIGGELEYADGVTIARALEVRREM